MTFISQEEASEWWQCLKLSSGTYSTNSKEADFINPFHLGFQENSIIWRDMQMQLSFMWEVQSLHFPILQHMQVITIINIYQLHVGGFWHLIFKFSQFLKSHFHIATMRLFSTMCFHGTCKVVCMCNSGLKWKVKSE